LKVLTEVSKGLNNWFLRMNYWSRQLYQV